MEYKNNNISSIFKNFFSIFDSFIFIIANHSSNIQSFSYKFPIISSISYNFIKGLAEMRY